MNDDRLIWLSDALDAIYGWVGVTEKDLEGILALRIYADLLNLPAVDAVEVVRCCSCRYHEDIDGYHECRRLRMRCPNDAEFFCKYGKRREDGDNGAV